MRGLDMQRPRLQELEAFVVERPFDLDRHAHQRLGLADEAPERHRLPGVETGLARKLFRHRLRRRAHVSAGLAVILAAGLDRAHEALAAEHDAVGHHLALRDRRAEPPGGADQHLAFGGLAQAAARRARRDHRLDQHRHRGSGRIESVVVHVAACIGGPQRRPAGAHRGEKLSLVDDAEEAFELAGEVGAGAILDQRRGADRTALPARRALRAPGVDQRSENLRRDRLLIELEPDLDREPALLPRVGVGIARDRLRQARDARSAGDRHRP